MEAGGSMSGPSRSGLDGQQLEPNTPEHTKALFDSIMRGTKLSNELPSAEQHDYASTFPHFNTAMSSMGNQLTRTMAALMEQQAHRAAAERFGKLDDVTERFDSVVDLSDALLERVDADLDMARGIGPHSQALSCASGLVGVSTPGRLMQPPSQQPSTPSLVTNNSVMQTPVRLPGSCGGYGAGCMSAGSATRPQLRWREEIDNSDRPFMPKLRNKPNALVPLQLVLAQAESKPGGTISRAQPSGWYINPYQHEIASFKPSEGQMGAPVERMYSAIHLTPCHWVDSEPALQQLRMKLAVSTEFALAIVRHVYRSYTGFICLLQISTREEDFLVDALELRNSLHVLNESFTNPHITKVMHGADSDVLWLQRDFGLYLVGLFDTGQAARVLELPSFSLSSLLQLFCNLSTSKAHQMSDWRLRPLPEEMLALARDDTHYLPYLHDRLKQELSKQERARAHAGTPLGQLLAAVWQRSAELSRQAYKVYPFDPDEHMALCRRQNAMLSPQQLAVHRAVFCWRDALARDEDESLAYVLPNHQLLKIAQAVPRAVEQLQHVLQPLPPLLFFHAKSLLTVINGVAELSGVASSDAQTPVRNSLESVTSAPSGSPGAHGASPCVHTGMPVPSTYGACAGGAPPLTPTPTMGGQMWPGSLHPMQPALPHQALSRPPSHPMQQPHNPLLSLQQQLPLPQQLPPPPPLPTQPPLPPPLPQQQVPMPMPPLPPGGLKQPQQPLLPPQAGHGAHPTGCAKLGSCPMRGEMRLGGQGYGSMGGGSGGLGGAGSFAGSAGSQNQSSEAPMPPMPSKPLPTQPSPSQPPNAASASGASGACCVRCPPSPSRSPPMHVDTLYQAAGWLPTSPAEEAAATGAGAGGTTASGRSAVLGGGGGGGLFSGCSSGSSDEDEPEHVVAAKASAQSIQAQLGTSPLWVLGLFAPQALPDTAPAAPGTVSAEKSSPSRVGGSAEHTVPRSLNEIYKLSNLNKRRGAAASRRPSEELCCDAASSASEGEGDGEAGGEERGDGEDGEDGEGEEEGVKRRRSGASDAVNANTSKEHTEDFMRRIGWLRAEGNSHMGLDGAADSHRQEMGMGTPGGTPGLGGAGESPMLPFQRQQQPQGMLQLPPHLPLQPPQQQQPGRLPMAMQVPVQGSQQHMSSAMGSNRTSPQQKLPMPPPMSMPPLPQMHLGGNLGAACMPVGCMGGGATQMGGGSGKGSLKAGGRPKKRTGFGGGGVEPFDYDAATAASPFVYSMQPPPQQQRGGYGGKGGGKGGKGGGGGKGSSRGRGGR